MASDNIPAPPPVPFRVNIGRPSRYTSKFCDEVIRLGAEGASLAQMSANFGVSRAGLWGWARQHEEFAAALSLARELSQTWWEIYGRQGKTNPSFDPTVWKTVMRCRFREDYTEIHAVETSQAPEQEKQIDYSVLPFEARETLRQLLIAARDGVYEEVEEEDDE